MQRYSRHTIALVILAALLTIAVSLPRSDSRDFRIARNLDIFISLIRELNTFYVDEFDPDKLITSVIRSTLNTLDPYTVYYPEEDSDDIAFMTTGQYGGIGAMIREDGDLAVVTRVYKDFPAHKAGVRAGDRLKKIDDKSLKNYGASAISDLLKGEPGSEIEITVERLGRDTLFQIRRERVALKAVPYYGMLDDGVTGYIRFTNFTRNCAGDVRGAVKSLIENDNAEQIILDVRGNPGGLLNEATEIVNIFVDPGNEVVSTRGRNEQFDAVHKTKNKALDTDIPLAVLISSGSASAAEIVAGAIQDLDRGVVIGQRSFGKGLVQITRPLSYNAQLKVTTAKYYIPSGRCIQALDYSDRREDGSVGNIPDSLISEFTTRNGRIVKDGGGIMPDIEIEPPLIGRLATKLYVQQYLFNFATRFYHDNPDIESIAQLTAREDIFEELIAYLAENEFSYTTSTEAALDNLIDAARQESYYDMHHETFSRLRETLSSDKATDMELAREDIIRLLLSDLAGRYLYEEGEIRMMISDDAVIEEARTALSDRERYTTILSPATGSTSIQ